MTRRRHAVAAIGLGLAVVACRPSSDDVRALGSSDLLGGVRTVEVDDRSHVETDVDYPDQPPLGGPHAPIWVNCGRYTQEVPAELAVHALEHGVVWITHPTDLGASELRRLAELADNQSHVLVSPLRDADTTVATAWGAQLQLESVEDPALNAFVEAYVQGPQTPEPGAPCSGGVGQPVP